METAGSQQLTCQFSTRMLVKLAARPAVRMVLPAPGWSAPSHHGFCKSFPPGTQCWHTSSHKAPRLI